MTTMSEVIDAATHLSLEEQREVLRRIEENIETSESGEPKPLSPLGLPPDFTERLQKLFYQAKLKALRAEPQQ